MLCFVLSVDYKQSLLLDMTGVCFNGCEQRKFSGMLGWGDQRSEMEHKMAGQTSIV